VNCRHAHAQWRPCHFLSEMLMLELFSALTQVSRKATISIRWCLILETWFSEFRFRKVQVSVQLEPCFSRGLRCSSGRFYTKCDIGVACKTDCFTAKPQVVIVISYINRKHFLLSYSRFGCWTTSQGYSQVSALKFEPSLNLEGSGTDCTTVCRHQCDDEWYQSMFPLRCANTQNNQTICAVKSHFHWLCVWMVAQLHAHWNNNLFSVKFSWREHWYQDTGASD